MITVLENIDSVYRANADKNAKHYLLCVKFAEYSRAVVKIIPAIHIFISVLYLGVMIMTADSEPIHGITLRPLVFLYFPPNTYGNIEPNVDIPIFVVNLVLVYYVLSVLLTNVTLLATIIVHEVRELEQKLNDEQLDRTGAKKQLLHIIRLHEGYKKCVLANDMRDDVEQNFY